MEAVRARRDAGKRVAPRLVRHGRERRFRDEEPRVHPRVDVALHADDTAGRKPLGEALALHGDRLVEERVALHGRRMDVVEDRVGVQDRHGRSLAHDLRVGLERAALLVDPERSLRKVAPLRPLEPHEDVAELSSLAEDERRGRAVGPAADRDVGDHGPRRELRDGAGEGDDAEDPVFARRPEGEDGERGSQKESHCQCDATWVGAFFFGAAGTVRKSLPSDHTWSRRAFVTRSGSPM